MTRDNNTLIYEAVGTTYTPAEIHALAATLATPEQITARAAAMAAATGTGTAADYIDTAEQARAAVSAAKFSPVGTRGTCRFVRSAGFGAVPGSEYFSKAQDTVVILQAEGTKAVENLDEILDVPGIDVVFIGPYDLSSALGHVGEIDHPEVVECIKGIIAKASAKGVKLGCFADTVEGGKKWRDLGVKFIGYACDTYIFMQAAKADVDAFAK